MEERYEGRKFRTEFLSHELPEDSRMAEAMDWGARFYKIGLMPPAPGGGHAGNVSFRNHKGFIITAGGVHKGGLTPKNFVQILSCNPDTRKVDAEGELEPSSETFMHHLVYSDRPDINAIIHVHDHLVEKHAGELKIPSTKTVHPYGTLELAQEVARSVGKKKFIVIKGHGVLSMGKSLWEAARLILTMHDLAAR